MAFNTFSSARCALELYTGELSRLRERVFKNCTRSLSESKDAYNNERYVKLKYMNSYMNVMYEIKRKINQNEKRLNKKLIYWSIKTRTNVQFTDISI